MEAMGAAMGGTTAAALGVARGPGGPGAHLAVELPARALQQGLGGGVVHAGEVVEGLERGDGVFYPLC